MSHQIVILWSDALLFGIALTILLSAGWVLRHKHLHRPWRQVLARKRGIVTLIVLSTYLIVALLDSMHYRAELTPSAAHQHTAHYSVTVTSVLDALVYPLGKNTEKTYSAPFALTSFVKESRPLADGSMERVYFPLKHVDPSINTPAAHRTHIMSLGWQGLLTALGYGGLLFTLLLILGFVTSKQKKTYWHDVLGNKRCWLAAGTAITLLILVCCSLNWSQHYHILGTDKIGEDVFYQAIKSIRTGLIIGTVTTLVMLPLALLLGTLAGYCGGLVDDVIQYLYTTLSSIPGVLLIAAAVLMLQVSMNKHPELFASMAERGDARLLALCFILGLTSWTTLCRLIRAEVMKIKTLDFVLAARALGVSQTAIMVRHLLPNIMHLVFIIVALDFSGLVLAEAVLSYVGVGVDPTTQSWGNMINQARLELAREPAVWWSLAGSFVFMFVLVLSANLFADVVRDAFDPRVAR